MPPDALQAVGAAIDLRLQVEALKRVVRQKDDSLAMVAHELRHPLAAIHYAAAALAASLRDAPAVQAPLATLKRQTDQLIRLVDDLLEISRIEQGQLLLQDEEVEIAKVLEQGIETAQPLIEQRRQQLIVVKPLSSLLVFGDRGRLVQCVSNLLENASKYTHEGGEIHATVRETGGRVSVEIRDNGIGIAPELIAHVFDLYVRSAATSESPSGLGIGLSLVRRLIEMQGGSVEAVSDGVGLGSTFTIHLWRAERSEAG